MEKTIQLPFWVSLTKFKKPKLPWNEKKLPIIRYIILVLISGKMTVIFYDGAFYLPALLLIVWIIRIFFYYGCLKFIITRELKSLVVFELGLCIVNAFISATRIHLAASRELDPLIISWWTGFNAGALNSLIDFGSLIVIQWILNKFDPPNETT